MIAAAPWNLALLGFACPVCARLVAPTDTLRDPSCAACAQPLLARYDLDRVRSDQPREAHGRQGFDLWRYGAVLPFTRPGPELRLVNWLPAKDRPVLAAAIRLHCDALVTGDHTHFGAGYGKVFASVAIYSPRSLAEQLFD